MSERPGVVRSYQRVFRPDRRLYAVDGRTIPVPGGVPLRWLGTATIALVSSLLIAAFSPVLILIVGGVTGAWFWRLGRRRLVVPGLVGTTGGLVVLGLLLRLVDWPLRLIVLPAAAATALTQLSPDGRGAHRFLWSWLRAQVAGRRLLGDPWPAPGRCGEFRARVDVASDCHQPELQRAVLRGPGSVRFGSPVMVCRSRRGRVVCRLGAQRHPRGAMVDRLELRPGERLRVRP